MVDQFVQLLEGHAKRGHVSDESYYEDLAEGVVAIVVVAAFFRRQQPNIIIVDEL
jgi:hypothetical protein